MSAKPLRWTVWSTLVVLALLSSCTRRATQLLAVVETDVMEGAYECIRIEVGRVGPSGTTPGGTAAFLTPEQVTLPFSSGVVPPDGDARARVEVAVEMRTDTCADRVTGEAAPLVRRVVRTGFLPEQTLRLPIFLAGLCQGVTCSDTESCDPLTGMCVAIMDIAPESLSSVAPGDELMDGGTITRDTGTPVDATLLPDSPLPDAGATCPTVGTDMGASGQSATIAFGLAHSEDGSRGVRSFVFGNGAGAMGITGGSSLGGGWFAIGHRGPTGVALLDDGSVGAMTFTHLSGGLRFDAFRGGSSMTNLSIGGACATSRCIAEFDGEFAVLRGPGTLSLVTVGTDAVMTGTTPVASGTTQGAVRTAATGVLVSYALGGACHLERWPTLAAMTESVAVPGCASLDMAELPDGRVAVAWIDATNGVQSGIWASPATSVTSTRTLDSAQGAFFSTEVNATATGYRVTWVDDLATPMIRSVSFMGNGTPLTSDCAATSGHTLAEYSMFHAVRRGATSAIEWPVASSFFGVVLTD